MTEFDLKSPRYYLHELLTVGQTSRMPITTRSYFTTILRKARINLFVSIVQTGHDTFRVRFINASAHADALDVFSEV
jgi:hypothetical protein